MSSNGFKITLAAARVNKSMTQDDVAKALGVTRNSVMNWENGKTVIKASQLFELSKLYDIPVEFISLPDYSTKIELNGE